MFKKSIVTMALLLGLCVPAFGQSTLDIEYAYDKVPEPETYSLYMNGSKVCQKPASDGKLQCESIDVPYGASDFTLTANHGELESPPSPVYVFNRELGVPTISRMTVVVTVNVNVETSD